MIRGRKEGVNGASWFIGFDHDDTFGLTPFPELDLRPSRQDQPVSRAVSIDSLAGQGQPARSQTPVATQTADPVGPTYSDSGTCTEAPSQNSDTRETAAGPEPSGVLKKVRSSSVASDPRPKWQDFDTARKRRSKDRDTEVIYREALEGARRAEEFKFRVKFDNLLLELHQAIQDKNPDGLANCFTSPAYGEVMLTFRDKVKDLLKNFTQRLTLAHESFDPNSTLETTATKVKQDVSKFIEDLIGETLDLTSEEAVSDLSSLSDESINDQNSFEDLKAQAVVTKLIENHRREVSGAVDVTNSNRKDLNVKQNIVVVHEKLGHNILTNSHGQGDILVNGHHKPGEVDFYRSDSYNEENAVLDNVKKLNSKNNLSSDVHLSDVSDAGIDEEPSNNNVEDVIDIEKDFEELKEFVRKTQSSIRPKVEAVEFDDADLCEVREEPLGRSRIDHDENREEFLTRYNVFDKVHNVEQDFSQFDNIDFTSTELDPDLLSMNLEIIPEETEEELEKEEDDDGKWKSNWIFKGSNGGQNESKGRPVNKIISRPDITYMPYIDRNRDAEYMSDPDIFSPSDLDGSDDEENTYYAHTSKELARISSQRNKYRSGNTSDDSDFGLKQRSPLRLYDDNSQDYADGPVVQLSGPIVVPSKQESKLLQDLIPADDDDPRFVIPPESVTIQEGEPVKFSCRIAGTQPIDVFWYREGDEVEEFEESEDVELSSSGDKHSITLHNVSKSMAGQYMCIALNEKGKATQYLVVSVKSNKLELKKPEFIKGLKDVEVTEGQSVKFRVKVKGIPPPRINWYKDGTLLKSSKFCRLEKFGNRDYILTIDHATMNDDAEYTVCARNVAGEVKLSAQVIVEPKSESPVKKQRHSSMTTSGASDSDSDLPQLLAKSNIIGYPISSNLTSPTAVSKPHIYEQDNQVHMNHIDQKMSLAQKKMEEESRNMKEDEKRMSAIRSSLISLEAKVKCLEAILISLVSNDWGLAQIHLTSMDQPMKSSRLLSPSTVDLLKTAEEIIQQERSNNLSNGNISDSTDIFSDHPSETSSQIQAVVDDLDLPDTLDDFPLSSQEPLKQAPVKSTLEFSFMKSKPSEAAPPTNARETHKPKSENFTKLLVSSGDHLTKVVPNNLPTRDFNQNDTSAINTSFDSGKGASLQDISTSLASSFSSNSSSRDNIESDLEQAKNSSTKISYSRDFEVVHPTEKKKWTVNLEPFSPQAEIVNIHNSINKPSIEVSNADFSLTTIRGDSQASSPRQSIDSGVSVSSKLERPAPVHMVGHTSEDEVPESRTEFNTDGSIDLPSVSKLRAKFSCAKDDDLGDGNFKRVHSITARSVPKDKLEKLRASNQKTASSLLHVPGEMPKVASTASLNLGSQPAQAPSLVLSSPPALSTPTLPAPEQHQVHGSTYIDVRADREPVQIYPQDDTKQPQQHLPVSMKTVKAPAPPQNHQASPLLSQTAASNENDATKKGGPRIKSGCISARTAFWERKMIDGTSVNDNEFPEMLEDGDS